MSTVEKNDDNKTFEGTNIDVMRKKSKAAGTAKRARERRVKMSLSKYMKSLGVAFGIGGIVVGTVMPQVEKVRESFVDTSVISECQMDFRNRIVNQYGHICEDQVNFWYDYAGIASKMMEYDDFDTAVYLLCTVDSHLSINSVLACTEYENLDNYLNARGYKDKDEFMEVARKKMLLSAEISEKSQELQNMQNRYDGEKTEISISGGRK